MAGPWTKCLRARALGDIDKMLVIFATAQLFVTYGCQFCCSESVTLLIALVAFITNFHVLSSLFQHVYFGMR